MDVSNEKASVRLSNATPPEISQRRQSLPAGLAPPKDKTSGARGHIAPASPEIISSLISSLSSISTPAQSHFDSLPRIGSQTAPPSPTSAQNGGHSDFTLDYGSFKAAATADGDVPLLHSYNAAMSPVIRMSKPPSSVRSPRSSVSYQSCRNAGDDTGSARSPSRASHGSVTTVHEESASFGVVRLEPGSRISNTSLVSSGSRRSLKNQLGLLRRSSRDSTNTRSRDIDPSGAEEGRLVTKSRSRFSLRSAHSMADLAEEGNGTLSHSSIAPNQTNGFQDPRRESAPTSKEALPTPEAPNFSLGGIGSGRSIPTRESSLRHSFNGTSTKKRRSARYSGYSHKDVTVDQNITEVSSEPDQVTQRINEIKDHQKKVKDRMVLDDRQPPSQSGSTKANGRTSAQNIQLTKVDELAADNESAPSPTVSTRRIPSVSKRSVPLAAKATNLQVAPATLRLKNEEPHKHGRALDMKNHRRTLSDSLSTAPRASTDASVRPTSPDVIEEAVEAYVTAPRLTQKVQHPQTGRIIAFSEVGDPNGHVVFCCVGMGLTRYLTAFYDELARTLKLRLITPDRPGVGESDPCLDGTGTPLNWPDDLALICKYLKISKFSMLAHSAGAIYALATALRMPQHIRGRIHLLAPWIPPSQMSGMGSHKDPLPANALPYSQRLLRALPTPILKVANSRFMTATSASITSSLPKSSRKPKRRGTVCRESTPTPAELGATSIPNGQRRASSTTPRKHPSTSPQETAPVAESSPSSTVGGPSLDADSRSEKERQSEYDSRLTHAIWELATSSANPAVDLLICLERRRAIGFRYVDINRAVVIHHGSRDTRVPVDNVRWLGKTMRRCEVRVLEGEGHGLMASATVMSNGTTRLAQSQRGAATPEKPGHDANVVFDKLRPGSRRPDNRPSVATVPAAVDDAGSSEPTSAPDQPPPEQTARTEMNSILKQAPIVIFSKSYCPYSRKAKLLLLEKYDIVPRPLVVELDQHPLGKELQALLASDTGRRTVPNVLVDGKSIGGGDEIEALYTSGELGTKLQAGERVKAAPKADLS
uniref:Hydrolase n=1 Tax=Onygena corvina TaxID=180788 RepID=A0A0B4VM41_9EURO|nr:hydrolase [Onygena corvina]